MADFGELDPSLKNLVDQESLQWIFVGGKGGVGKTTTSCCVAAQVCFASTRSRMLLLCGDAGYARDTMLVFMCGDLFLH